jgi:hypothetical protein
MSRLLNRFFGGRSVSKAAARRPTSRLGVERLDERALPSATGSVSQVVDHNGDVVAFFIDRNGVLERSVNGGAAQAVDPWGCHCDQQVSAGTDAYGNAVAYVRNGYGSLWQIGWGWGGSLYETHIGDNVTSFSAVMGTVWGGTQGGVYFIGNGYDILYQNGYYQGLSGGQYDQQISAGTDQNGYSVAYVLNRFNRDVYERYANGSFSGDLTNCGCTTQVVGSVKGYFYTNDDARDVFVHNGYAYRFLEGNVTQLSAGTDYYGNSTVDLLRPVFWFDTEVDQFDAGPNGPYSNGWYSNPYRIASNMTEIAAGSNGFDYYVDWSSQLHVNDPWGNDWVIGWNAQ